MTGHPKMKGNNMRRFNGLEEPFLDTGLPRASSLLAERTKQVVAHSKIVTHVTKNGRVVQPWCSIHTHSY